METKELTVSMLTARLFSLAINFALHLESKIEMARIQEEVALASFSDEDLAFTACIAFEKAYELYQGNAVARCALADEEFKAGLTSAFLVVVGLM